MFAKKQWIFWLSVWLLLVLLFSTSLNGFIVSTYFVTLLMPIVIATSVFFNRFLVPRYLLQNRKWTFSLYFFYMLVVSIYLELLVMVLAFVILADYQIDNLGKIAGDIYLLTLILYLVVLVEGLVLSIQKLKENAKRIEEIELQLVKHRREEITIRCNRKNVLLKLFNIQFIESLGDYVKVHAKDRTYTTKEKISTFEGRLPDSFIRIHRSFLVNKDHVDFFNKEVVNVGDKELPIGRKYKKSASEALQASLIA
ncbi:LytR/AlgR family response regulator transcription factor [Ekhidna sp.]|uniref:LytR/AlgR family response regulator transcription factor n=1 Tax=Ekhidna sp. TaxID=2608089 RepID=UPI003C7E627A